MAKEIITTNPLWTLVQREKYEEMKDDYNTYGDDEKDVDEDEE